MFPGRSGIGVKAKFHGNSYFIAKGTGSKLKVEEHKFRCKEIFSVPPLSAVPPHLRGHCSHEV